jgi:hypothetical protein
MTRPTLLPRSGMMLLLVLLAGVPVSAQSWEIEVHGGGMLAHNPNRGQGALPGPGASFTPYASIFPSHHVSSWYFGNGASMLSDFAGSLPRVGAGRIVPLDAVLQSAALERPDGGSFGFRLARRFGPYLAADLSFDYGTGRSRLNRSSLDGIEASRASFPSAWNGIMIFFGLLPGGAATSPSVTSTAEVHNEGSRPIFSSATASINFKKRGKLVPYATLGAGYLWNQGEGPRATLVGNYRFRADFSNQLPINETDTVTLRFSNGNAVVGILGLGVKYDLSGRWGLRADVREFLSSNRSATMLEARPVDAVLLPAGFLVVGIARQSLQFSNNPTVTTLQSTLAGPITGFQTFKGTGWQGHLNVVVGLFLRL